MKKIFTYFGIVLSIALMGAFTACTPRELDDLTESFYHCKRYYLLHRLLD